MHSCVCLRCNSMLSSQCVRLSASMYECIHHTLLIKSVCVCAHTFLYFFPHTIVCKFVTLHVTYVTGLYIYIYTIYICMYVCEDVYTYAQ